MFPCCLFYVNRSVITTRKDHHRQHHHHHHHHDLLAVQSTPEPSLGASGTRSSSSSRKNSGYIFAKNTFWWSDRHLFVFVSKISGFCGDLGDWDSLWLKATWHILRRPHTCNWLTPRSIPLKICTDTFGDETMQPQFRRRYKKCDRFT